MVQPATNHGGACAVHPPSVPRAAVLSCSREAAPRGGLGVVTCPGEHERGHAGHRTLLGEVYPYFLTYRILERYADLRRSLRRPHGPGLIGDIDTLIAATSFERNLTVVTIDTDFQRVPDLRVILLSRSTMQVLSTP